MKTSLKKSKSIESFQPRHTSINLESLKLKQLHSAYLDDNEDSNAGKNICIFHIHTCARFLLIMTFVLSVTNIVLLPMDEYRDFKMFASAFDSCVIILALGGNFGKYRLAYWPFFIVHAIFIGALAILSTSLLFITFNHIQKTDRMDNRVENKEEKLLLMLGYNLLQFVLHSYVYIKVGSSYRYLGEQQCEKDELKLPDLLIKTENGQFLMF